VNDWSRSTAEQLGRLLDEHGPALRCYAAQWTDERTIACRRRSSELAKQRQSPEHVVAWLYRVVKHRALNAARGDRRRRERESRQWRSGFRASEQPAAFGRDEAIARRMRWCNWTRKNVN